MAFFIVYFLKIQNDMIASVSECMIKEVESKCVYEAVFIALIFDKASNRSMKTHI
jgi:hypothetical protein